MLMLNFRRGLDLVQDIRNVLSSGNLEPFSSVCYVEQTTSTNGFDLINTGKSSMPEKSVMCERNYVLCYKDAGDLVGASISSW
jgi:hypothetical protein